MGDWGKYRQDGPDFVMLGMPHEDGVVIYASRQLSAVELAWECERVTYDTGHGYLGSLAGAESFTITTHCGEVTRAFGDSYAEAFANLFRSWQPPRNDERKGLPPADLALGPG